MRLLIGLSLLLISSHSFADSEHEHDHDRDRDRDPRLAVATDPIGLFAGTYALSATYVARLVTLRGDVQITEDMPGLPGSGNWRAAISVPLYLDRPLHGPFVEPGIALADRFMGYSEGVGVLGGTDPGLGGLMTTTIWTPQRARSIEPQIFVGWQWMFRSRFHIAGAVGVARHFATDGSGTSYSIPQSYLRVGVAL